jgi:hypothetical protein
MRDIYPTVVDRAIRANDVCSMVDTLLSGALARAFITVIALKVLFSRGVIKNWEHLDLLRGVEKLSIGELRQSVADAVRRQQ